MKVICIAFFLALARCSSGTPINEPRIIDPYRINGPRIIDPYSGPRILDPYAIDAPRILDPYAINAPRILDPYNANETPRREFEAVPIANPRILDPYSNIETSRRDIEMIPITEPRILDPYFGFEAPRDFERIQFEGPSNWNRFMGDAFFGRVFPRENFNNFNPFIFNRWNPIFQRFVYAFDVPVYRPTTRVITVENFAQESTTPAATQIVTPIENRGEEVRIPESNVPAMTIATPFVENRVEAVTQATQERITTAGPAIAQS